MAGVALFFSKGRMCDRVRTVGHYRAMAYGAEGVIFRQQQLRLRGCMGIMTLCALTGSDRHMNALLSEPFVGVIMTGATKIGDIVFQQLGILRTVRSMTVGADTVRERRMNVTCRQGRFEIGVAIETEGVDVFGE